MSVIDSYLLQCYAQNSLKKKGGEEIMMDVNWLAILAAAVVYNVIGFAWYSDALFAKQWRKESGVSTSDVKNANMGRMFAFMAVQSLVMGYVLSVVLKTFGVSDLGAALTASFWVWLGFVATVMLNFVNYEGKSWNYFAINAGYQLVGLLVMGAVLVMVG